MRRIVLLLAAAAIMSVMAAVGASPASAMGCKGAAHVLQHAPPHTPAFQKALFVKACPITPGEEL